MEGAFGQMKSESGKILIFGGTTEGRTVAERLLAEGLTCTVCVATQYGEEVLQPHPLMTVHTGRMDCAGMTQMMQKGPFSCVIDATHPHAQLVSKEIRSACEQTGLPYLRLQREDADETRCDRRTGDAESKDQSCIYVSDVEEAGTYLSSVPGRILVTTGSKELACFAKALGDPSRITARVLPAKESLKACAEAGLTGKQIFAMQGPFGTDMNCALIRHAQASWLLTKETGAAGGYPEKIEASQKCGIRAVVIRTPSTENESRGTVLSDSFEQQGALSEEILEAPCKSPETAPADAGQKTQQDSSPGTGLERTIEKALQYAGTRKQRSGILSLVGVGVGAQEAGTQQAQEAIASAQVIFGAKTVLENLTKNWKPAAGKKIIDIYDSSAILDYLREHPEVRNAVAAYSGDSGFYSGAASMLSKLEKEESFKENYEIRVICGISSVSWFAARAGIPWQNWKILSSHGRFCNVTGHVRRNRECFLLLANAADLRQTGALLARAQEQGALGKLQLIYGHELSREGEKICPCTPQDLIDVTQEGLYVLYIRNDDAEKVPVLPGMPDTAFIRGKAPMTSSEIRTLSLSRLGLTEKSVLWDVGAGTGSVSVEAALACPEGRVWSIECKKDALALLAENRAKYCLQNMSIIGGYAPDALVELPVPTHVFIGGSGGEIGSILDFVLARNSSAKVVVNCITSETLAALHAALDRLPIRDLQCMQVMVNREEVLGTYHYLRAGNPVFIISFQGAGKTQDCKIRIPLDRGID